MNIVSTKNEYSGRTSYKIASSTISEEAKIFIIVLLFIIGSIFIGNIRTEIGCYSNIGNQLYPKDLCAIQIPIDIFRLLAIFCLYFPIKTKLKDIPKSYEIIVDENLEVIILRQNAEKDIILFSDAKGVKFKFFDDAVQKTIIDDHKRDTVTLGRPILEMISGLHIEMLDLVSIDEFSTIADKINLVLKEYHSKAAEEPSRVKSKSQDVSVKDL